MNNFTFIPNDEHFQKIRHKTIGASDIPIILGLIKQKTPYDLFLEKTGRAEVWEGNNITDWGHLHEITILYKHIKDTENETTAYKFLKDYVHNLKTRTQNYSYKTNYLPFTEFIHPELKFAMAHPDMIDIQNEINIEAKSGKYYANKKRDGMDGYDKDDPNGYPLKVYFQVQWQSLCTGIQDNVVRALIDTSDEMEFKIQGNKKIQEKLIEIASRFMWNVKNDKPPMPVNYSDIKGMFPKVKKTTAYALGADGIFCRKAVDRKKFLESKIKKFKNEVDDIKDSLALLIGENEILFDEDNNKICGQVNFKKESINLKLLKEKHPDIYKDFVKEEIVKINEVRYIK